MRSEKGGERGRREEGAGVRSESEVEDGGGSRQVEEGGVRSEMEA